MTDTEMEVILDMIDDIFQESIAIFIRKFEFSFNISNNVLFKKEIYE